MKPATASLPSLGGWLLLCFAVASLGAIFPPGDWYASLRKPAWNPPAWIFAPVWTALYAAMAIAAWRVWRRGARRPLILFLIQLALNAAWTPLFFGLHRPELALLDIAALWLAIAATLLAFHREDRLAGFLFIPYLAWVSFATCLNFALWSLNS